MHRKEIYKAGMPADEARRVMILLHGRGASADDILSLAHEFDVSDMAYFAPQATANTWYPYSFLSPVDQNQPWLDSALSLLSDLERELNAEGFPSHQIWFAGFSQGACLALEYTARNAKRYGGILAFSGGLIGQKIKRENYRGHFLHTPVFIGSSDPDMHIPVNRVEESAGLLTELGASVQMKIYSDMGHTICRDEIEQANALLQLPEAN